MSVNEGILERSADHRWCGGCGLQSFRSCGWGCRWMFAYVSFFHKPVPPRSGTGLHIYYPSTKNFTTKEKHRHFFIRKGWETNTNTELLLRISNVTWEYKYIVSLNLAKIFAERGGTRNCMRLCTYQNSRVKIHRAGRRFIPPGQEP